MIKAILITSFVIFFICSTLLSNNVVVLCKNQVSTPTTPTYATIIAYEYLANNPNKTSFLTQNAFIVINQITQQFTTHNYYKKGLNTGWDEQLLAHGWAMEKSWKGS